MYVVGACCHMPLPTEPPGSPYFSELFVHYVKKTEYEILVALLFYYHLIIEYFVLFSCYSYCNEKCNSTVALNKILKQM